MVLTKDESDQEKGTVQGQPQISSPMTTILDLLKEQGFVHTLIFQNGKMRCAETESVYTPDVVKLLGLYRFEGQSDPEDLSAVYALEAKDGTRGVIVDAFGPNADPEITKFMQDVKDGRSGNELPNGVPDRKVIRTETEGKSTSIDPRAPKIEASTQ